ncbi:hypothetical protein [Micromonospora zamorensis]
MLEWQDRQNAQLVPALAAAPATATRVGPGSFGGTVPRGGVT